MKKIVNDLISQKDFFLRFMKEKYPIYQNSNIFLRDIQFAIKSYYEKKEVFLRSEDAEKAAFALTEYLTMNDQLCQINAYTWKVLFSTSDKTETPTPEPAAESDKNEKEEPRFILRRGYKFYK